MNKFRIDDKVSIASKEWDGDAHGTIVEICYDEDNDIYYEVVLDQTIIEVSGHYIELIVPARD